VLRRNFILSIFGVVASMYTPVVYRNENQELYDPDLFSCVNSQNLFISDGWVLSNCDK